MNPLPCPFCGKEPEEDDEDVCYPSGTGWVQHPINSFRHYVNFREAPPEKWCYNVNCVQHHGGCGASMQGDSKQEAIDKWNRRV